MFYTCLSVCSGEVPNTVELHTKGPTPGDYIQRGTYRGGGCAEWYLGWDTVQEEGASPYSGANIQHPPPVPQLEPLRDRSVFLLQSFRRTILRILKARYCLQFDTLDTNLGQMIEMMNVNIFHEIYISWPHRSGQSIQIRSKHT